MNPALALAALLACHQLIAPHSRGTSVAFRRAPGAWVLAARDGFEVFSGGKAYRFAYPESAQFLDNGDRAFYTRIPIGETALYGSFLVSGDRVFVDENPDPTESDLPHYSPATTLGEASTGRLREEVARRLRDYPQTYGERVKRWPASAVRIDWSACERAGLTPPARRE